MAKELPVCVRAAIAAWQLLTIHPFSDGNGRTARALSGYLLALGGYDLQGIYSLEEYQWKDLARYYASLQMGLPRNYYEGRNQPPDLGPWILYFLETMVQACNQVIEKLQDFRHPEELILSRLGLREKNGAVFAAYWRSSRSQRIIGGFQCYGPDPAEMGARLAGTRDYFAGIGQATNYPVLLGGKI